MIAAILLKVITPIVSLGIAAASVGYILLDNSNKTPDSVSSLSHGFQYYVTSSVKKDGKALHKELPKFFASNTDDDHAYACKIEVKKGDEGSEEVSEYVDNTCAIFELENFKTDGSKTFNLPVNLDSSMLLKDADAIEESHHQLLRLNKRFLNQMPRGGATISVVDKKTTSHTYMKLKLEFLFSAAAEKEIHSNLISVWIKSKNTRPDGITTTPYDKNHKFKCLIGVDGRKTPCKLYKYADKKTANTFTHTDLKTLTPVTDFNSDIDAGGYYVLDFLGHKKKYEQVANLDIGLYENINDTTDAETLSVIYDRHLYGRFTETGKHNIYLKSPKTRVFLAKKTKDSDVGKLTDPAWSEEAPNYRCKIDVNTRSEPNKLENFDDSCRLYDLPPIFNGKKNLSLTVDDFQAEKTLTNKSKLDTEIFFKLELDGANLFNLEFDPTKPNIPKIQIVPNTQQSESDNNKHYIELELVQEVTGIPEKFEGKSQLLLVQVRASANKFKREDVGAMKCKFFEGTESFDCDLYDINNQNNPLKDVDNKEDLDKLDLLPAKKADFSKEANYRQKQHYIVDIKTPISLRELMAKRPYFYIYKDNHGTPLPGQPEAQARADAAKNENKTTPVTNPSTSGKPAEPTKIPFSIIKIIDANLSSSKPAIFFN